MSSTAIRNRTEHKFMAIHLESIRVDSVLDFDLYINVNNQLVLYRSGNLPFTDRTLRKLVDNRVDRLYIAFENKKNYQRYIEKNLDKILVDPKIEEEKKAGILYDTSTNLVKDVLNNPTYGENIQRSKDLVSQTGPGSVSQPAQNHLVRLLYVHPFGQRVHVCHRPGPAVGVL